MFHTRAQVLAHGEDLGPRPADLADAIMDFLELFPETHHDSTLREESPGARMPEHIE